KFMKQYQDQGLKLPVLAGAPACDDALLKSFGDEALGVISVSAYTGDLDTPSNKRLIDGMVKDYGNIPGLYAAGLYINGMVAEAALEKTGGKTEDKDELIRALRAVSLTDTPRGTFTFDLFGNVCGSTLYLLCETTSYSVTLGVLLFLRSAGFSLIFGLMKIPNLTHGSFFMLGAYLATSLIAHGFDFWTAAIVGGLLVAALGGLVERLILRRLVGAELAQVLVTLGLSF